MSVLTSLRFKIRLFSLGKIGNRSPKLMDLPEIDKTTNSSKCGRISAIDLRLLQPEIFKLRKGCFRSTSGSSNNFEDPIISSRVNLVFSKK